MGSRVEPRATTATGWQPLSEFRKPLVEAPPLAGAEVSKTLDRDLNTAVDGLGLGCHRK